MEHEKNMSKAQGMKRKASLSPCSMRLTPYSHADKAL
jgi:hypothetical protein